MECRDGLVSQGDLGAREVREVQEVQVARVEGGGHTGVLADQDKGDQVETEGRDGR